MSSLLGEIQQRADRAVLLARKQLAHRFHRRREGLPRVMFVAGVQRSGTNMLMDALERSSQTEVFHERDPRAFDNYQLRDIDHIRSLVEESGAETVVLKCLMESQKLKALLREFPNVTGVWMFRHYTDVVNSMLRSFKNQAAQVMRIAKDRDADGWLGENMSNETHSIVQNLTCDPIDDPSGAAIQWYFRNLRYFEQGLENDSRINLMHYESLVTEPEHEIKWMFEQNQLRFERRITKWINARSVGKREPPAIRSDVKQLCDELYEQLIGAYKLERNAG